MFKSDSHGTHPLVVGAETTRGSCSHTLTVSVSDRLSKRAEGFLRPTTSTTMMADFTFDDWATEHGLSRKTTAALNKEECNNLDSLKLVTAEDINRMDIPVGQIRMLRGAVRSLGNPITIIDPPTPQPSDQQAGPSGSQLKEPGTQNTAVLQEAGQALQEQLEGQNGNMQGAVGGEAHPPRAGEGDLQGGQSVSVIPPVPTSQGAAVCRPYMGPEDPLLLLTAKATVNKALKITDFLLEPAKSRVSRSRREQVSFSSMAEGGIAIKTEENSNYYISFDEWSGANMRLAAHLLSTGGIAENKLVYYMAYTTMISDLAAQWDWGSILQFDTRYRDLQANHGFNWGTRLSHEQQQYLRPRRTTHNPKGNKGNKGGQDAQQICRNYAAKGECGFGNQCKYSHDLPTGGNPPAKKD